MRLHIFDESQFLELVSFQGAVDSGKDLYENATNTLYNTIGLVNATAANWSETYRLQSRYSIKIPTFVSIIIQFCQNYSNLQ